MHELEVGRVWVGSAISYIISYNKSEMSYNKAELWLDKKQKNRATVNPITKKDNECFQYAVTGSLNHEKIGVILKE